MKFMERRRLVYMHIERQGINPPQVIAGNCVTMFPPAPG
jgi:hypothetical protein